MRRGERRSGELRLLLLLQLLVAIERAGDIFAPLLVIPCCRPMAFLAFCDKVYCSNKTLSDKVAKHGGALSLFQDPQQQVDG